MSVVSVASEQAYGTCASCGAALVSDQRYCLECGTPCSPVRLAFLDVLQSGQDSAVVRSAHAAYDGELAGTAGVLPAGDAGGAPLAAWLRRNSGLLSLLSVLALCLIAGLLVGHWVSQSHPPSKQVVEVKGLPAASPSAAGTTPASTTTPATPSASPSSSKGTSSKPSAKQEEASDEKEAAAAEKAPAPKAVKVNAKKLSSTTGKKHEEEINALGAQPTESG